MAELFFNKESKDGTWEITYDSSGDAVCLALYFDDKYDPHKIMMTKKEFLKLQRFLKNLRLKPNTIIENLNCVRDSSENPF